MKTTCRKSWPENLSHVLNLTFDPCFKVKWALHTKTSFIFPLLLVLWLQNVKTEHERSGLQIFCLRKIFGLIFVISHG